MECKKTIFICIAAFVLCTAMLAGCSGENSQSGVPSGYSSESQTEITENMAETTEQTTEEEAAYDPTVTGAYEDGSTPGFSGTKLRLTVNGEEEVMIALYDNTAADALLERLPLENLSFFDLSGIEKPVERLEEPLFLGEEEPGYDPVTGEMVIYRPWGNFTIFYGDFRYSPELVPLGKVESGLEVLSSKTDNFTGVLELAEEE